MNLINMIKVLNLWSQNSKCKINEGIKVNNDDNRLNDSIYLLCFFKVYLKYFARYAKAQNFNISNNYA